MLNSIQFVHARISSQTINVNDLTMTLLTLLCRGSFKILLLRTDVVLSTLFLVEALRHQLPKL